MKNLTFLTFKLLLYFTLLSFSCSSNDDQSTTTEEQNGNSDLIAVTKVTVSRNEGAYTFSVEIKSPDTGCDQYANWWEVVTPDGDLVFRRILGHSHINEQPFTRSGSAIAITENQEVWVRVHMNNTGYSSKGYKGSIVGGFKAENIPSGFASDLETMAPQPDGCAF